MRRSIFIFTLTLLIFQTALAQFPAISNLTNLSITTNTREKPQSKVWMHDGKHWTVLSDDDGAHIWRLDGTSWTRILTIHNKDNRRADCKVDGNLVHILLFRPNESDLVSVEYVASNSTYKRWTSRTSTIRVPTDSDAETATIDIDTNGRMWMAYDNASNILVRYSDSPYSSWSNAITVASGIDADDIGAVVALPSLSKIGVFWSNQNTKRWGFKMHSDATDPNTWSADEIPASQSAQNIGQGMSDDHMNLKVTSNGTMYCAVKTGYDRPGYPRIALLIRRPSGTWDNLYGVSEIGTRGIAILNEQTNKIRIVYTKDEDGGDILYKESALSPIAFGTQYTLISGNYNNPTASKTNFTSEAVIIASTSSVAPGVLVTDNGTPPPLPGVPALNLPANAATGISLTPTLSWNASADAASYQLQVSTSSGFGTTVADISNISATSYNLSGLNYSTQYYWRVRAQNTAGTSNWSLVRNFTTMAEPIVVPDVPVLTLPANNATAVNILPTLNWNASNNANTYRLQVATSSTFTTIVSDSAGITSLSSQITGLHYSTKYFWRLKAYSHNGESNWSAIWNFTTETAPTAPPAIPALALPANNSTGASLTPTLSWNTANDAETYQLQLATSSDFVPMVSDLTGLTGTSEQLSGLVNNTQYFWRVRAHNSAGTSNWSATWTFTTLAQPVALVGHWQMEDPAGTTLSDASGNGNHATTSGNPGFVTGKIGQGLYLNGSNQYASVPTAASISPTNAITLAAWIKPDRIGSRQIVILKGSSNDGYELAITGSGDILFRYNQVSAGKSYQVTSSATVPSNGQTWAHIAATFDGSAIRIYYNGSLDKVKTYSSAPAIGTNTEPLFIGADNGSSRIQGTLDDVRIYNIALSATEISDLATVTAARMAAAPAPAAEPTIASQPEALLAANPNPFRHATTLNFTVPASGEYTVTLYNMAGQPVKILKQGVANCDENITVGINGSKLRSGLYMVRLQTARTSQSLKLIREF